VSVTAHGGHFEHILCWSFHGSVCVKLMLRIFEFGFYCLTVFIYWQNVTRLKRKRFTRYRHYVGEVEDIIIGTLAVVSKLERLVAVYDAVLKSSWLCFFCGHPVYV